MYSRPPFSDSSFLSLHAILLQRITSKGKIPSLCSLQEPQIPPWLMSRNPRCLRVKFFLLRELSHFLCALPPVLSTCPQGWRSPALCAQAHSSRGCIESGDDLSPVLCWPLGLMVRVGFVGRLTGVFCVFIASRVLVTRGKEDM